MSQSCNSQSGAFDVLNVVTFLSGDKTALNDEDDLKDQRRVGSALKELAF